MRESTSFQENDPGCNPKQDNPFHKGESVVYEGTTCRVTRVRPFLVIKCGNRVVCGNLHKQIKPVNSYHH
jgi:hypothetical protein